MNIVRMNKKEEGRVAEVTASDTQHNPAVKTSY